MCLFAWLPKLARNSFTGISSTAYWQVVKEFEKIRNRHTECVTNLDWWSEMIIIELFLWGGFNLENGNLKNRYFEGVLILKMGVTGISKESDGYLENNLENWYLKKCVRNWSNRFPTFLPGLYWLLLRSIT